MDQHPYKPGQTIRGTQYRFVRTIGSGAHGTVCVVEHSFLEAPAVMKLLHAELALEHGVAQRMTREAKTLAKLRHPNIVEVRDGGMTVEAPARPYFVMEYLAGTTLRDVARKMPGTGLGVLPSIRIMLGVMDGLHHAHAAGVIHRDIKPDNIFLNRTTTDKTVPKILDFGIAHLLGGERLTGENVLGTPRYAAPEQLLGERVAAPSDVYSAGLVLWELITGQQPFAAQKTFEALLKAHVLDRLPPPSSLTRDATPEVDTLLAYLTDRDPTRRPPTAYAASVALREVQALLNARDRDREPTDLEVSGFNTRPTPLENALLEASPNSVPLVIEVPQSDLRAGIMGAPTQRRPELDPPQLETMPMTNRPNARLEAALGRAREPEPGPPAPPPPAPPPPRPTTTVPLVVPPPQTPQPQPPPPSRTVSSPPSSRPRPPPSVGQRVGARPVLLFFAAFALIAGVGVPVAVTVTRYVMAARSTTPLPSPVSPSSS